MREQSGLHGWLKNHFLHPDTPIVQTHPKTHPIMNNFPRCSFVLESPTPRTMQGTNVKQRIAHRMAKIHTELHMKNTD
jgi:hypothetical protein